MSISVNNVSKFYGRQKALDSVSFDIVAGEIVGFLGPNGAGKSTMMKIICGYLPQNKGEIKVCGLDVLENELEVKSRLGYLPENNPLYQDMYVREYLSFTAGIYKLDEVEDRVKEVIEKVGLGKEQNKKIGELSKGYRQRVGLAQSFIHEPDVLILDEPTTGLDPNQIVEIRQLIQEIGRDKTVLLSTHIMQEVEAICDRAIIINEGQIVEDKKVGELKAMSGGEKKLDLTFARDIEEVVLIGHLGRESVQTLSNRHFLIDAGNMSETKIKIMQIALENKWEIHELKEGSSSLEDVFRQLTTSKEA